MSDICPPVLSGVGEARMGCGIMSTATCMHCLSPFARLPKSIAAYCSSRCRSEAREAPEAAKREERMAPLNAILNAGPPEVTDISVITYREYQIAWTQTDSNAPDNSERTFATRSLGSLPSYVLMALVEKAPDIIPEEVMMLAPDDPMTAIRLHTGHPWWKEVLTPEPTNKDIPE